MASWKLLSLSLLGYFSSAVCAKNCIVPTASNSSSTVSDSKLIEATFAQCSQDSTIIFQKGINYNVFEPISATNLSNVIISVQGNLNLPQDIPAVQKIVAAGGGSVHWFDFKGTNVQYIGTEDVRSNPLISFSNTNPLRLRLDGSGPTGSSGGMPTRPAQLVLLLALT